MSTGNFKPSINNEISGGVLSDNRKLEKGIQKGDSYFPANFPIKGNIPEKIDNELIKLNKDYFLDEKGVLTKEAKQKFINLWYAYHDFRFNKNSKDDERKKIEIIKPDILLGMEFERYFREASLLSKVVKCPDSDPLREKVLDFQLEIAFNSIISEDVLYSVEEKLKESVALKIKRFLDAQIKLDAYIIRDNNIQLNYIYFDQKYYNHKYDSDIPFTKLLEERNKLFENVRRSITIPRYSKSIGN